MRPSITIGFSWNGLPQYAARLIRAAITQVGCDSLVVGSPPNVPVEGMERVLGQKVHWVNAMHSVRWSDLGVSAPDIFFQSGWAYPAFATLGREVKARNGNIVCLSDANWRGDLRQLLLGPAAFRIRYRKHFDAMLVPGRQGARLMSYFGMPPDRVRIGMYGADPALFHGGAPLHERPKVFLYVGQIIPRKNVLGLVEAFLGFAEKTPGWTLQIIGSGEQKSLIPRHHPRILVKDFVQPEELAKYYRAARFLVLPSLAEAWGLVVHEASLCGCGLILSNAIGSGDDLAAANAIRHKPGSVVDLERALIQAATFEESRLREMERISRNLASQFGPDRFAREVRRLADEFTGRNAIEVSA